MPTSGARDRPHRVRLCVLGFGAATRRLFEILDDRQASLAASHDVEFVVAAVGTAHHGSWLPGTPRSPAQVLDRAHSPGWSFPEPPRSGVDLIGSSVADVLVEATPLEPGGTAAIGHVQAALHHGLDVVCLNKGPVAWDYRRLAALADEHGRQFRFEGIVMDGCPTFSLVAGSLPGVRVSGFCGVLNSTSNVVLDHLADGGELADAVRHAQQEGFAEADPRHDLSGYDTAVKVAALANVWLDADVDPDTISCTGVDESLAEAARTARAGGRQLRLLGSAARHDDHVDASVDLVAVDPTSPFFATAGPSSTLQIVTDLAGVVEVTERAPGLTQTAYAVLADLLHCAVGAGPGRPRT